MTFFVRIEDQDELAELVPLIQAYVKTSPNENAEAILVMMKIVTEIDPGVVIKAVDKNKAIGYIVGTIAADITGKKLCIIGIFADKWGTGKVLLEKIEEWARDDMDVHHLRSVTRNNPDAMSRLFGAVVTGYVLEKEF